jgi:hypothetical protein
MIIDFKSTYENFQSRTFGFKFKVVFFLIIFFINVLFIAYKAPWTVRLVMNLILFSSIVDEFFKFKFYLDEIKIDLDSKTIELTVFKYDYFYAKTQFQFNEIEIKIIRHWIIRTWTNELKIIHKNKCLVRQQETKYWTLDKFEEIERQVKKNK